MSEQAAAAAPGGRSSAAREFFAQLRKGAKAIAMYRHNPSRFADILKPSHGALTTALEPGPLVVRVTAEAFVAEEQEVWQADGGENVPFRFYREGIRQLVLRPGLSEEELGKLVLILLTPTERTGEEILGQLWAASFEHVDYVAVDGFKVDEMSESEVHVEIDKLVDYLAARLRGDSEDTVAFARISAADLDLKLEGIDQLRGGIFDGDGVTESFKGRLQKELARDEREKLPARVVSLLELQLRDGAVDPAGALELLTQLVDGALLYEDFSPVVRSLDALARVAGAPGPGQQQAESLQARLGERLAEDARLRRLGEILKHNPSLDPASVGRYLSAIGAESVPALLDVLETLDQGPIRGPFVEALARLAPQKPELLAGRLENANSASVRDLIAIVVRGNFPDGARYLQAALRNPNPQVKVAVVSELGASPRPEMAHRFVLEASVDKNSAVRAAAFRSMVQLSPGRAAQDLLRLPKLPDWEKRDAAERELIHVCIGQTQRTEALAYLQGLLMQKKNLLNAKKVLEGKLQAIAGLQAMATLHAFKILQGVAADAKEEDEVVAAARKSMYAVKKVLFESTAAARPSSSPGQAVENPGQAAEALFDQFQSAQKESADAAEAEKRRIAEAIQARQAAEAAEAARKEKERQEAMQRPFGLDPAALAALTAQPAKPPPLPPGSRPPTSSTRITETGPGQRVTAVPNTSPRVSAANVPNTSPRIDANGRVLPPPPPSPDAKQVAAGDEIDIDIDLDGEGG